MKQHKVTIGGVEFKLSATDAKDNVVVASKLGVSYWNPIKSFDTPMLSITLNNTDLCHLIYWCIKNWRDNSLTPKCQPDTI